MTVRGPYSAIFTPFDTGNAVDFEMLARLADFQIARGLGGFFACGSTGEGLLLTESERNEVIKQLVGHVKGRANVIAHVGHPSTAAAVRMAKSAAQSGADWIASVAPFYHGTTFDGACRHYAAIASATELPFMIYSLGGVIEPERDAKFFKIPNVSGLKYTGANFYSVQQMMRFVDRPITLMSGFDEQFIAGQSFGFAGGIGSTYNFGPGFYADIYRLFRAGDLEKAAQIQASINKVTYLMAKEENWSYRKAIMRYIGLNCGACRAPYAPLTETEYETFASKLDELDVLKRDEALANIDNAQED